MSGVRLPRICWPIEIDSTNKTLVIYKGSSGTTVTVTIPEGTYYTPEALLYALKTAADTALAAVSSTMTTILSSSGVVTLRLSNAGSGTSWSLKFTSTDAAALGVLLGFSEASTPADKTSTSSLGLVSFTGSQQVQNLWLSDAPITDDTEETSAFGRAIVESTGGVMGVDVATLRRRKVRIDFVADPRVFIRYETTLNTAIERLWQDGATRFLWFDDASDTGLGATPAATAQGDGLFYSLDEPTAQRFDPERPYLGLPVHNLELSMVGTE